MLSDIDVQARLPERIATFLVFFHGGLWSERTSIWKKT